MAGRLRPRVRVIHRKLLTSTARDMTESTARRSALVLAPHPDDETLGCGATIARKAAAGASVQLVVATGGDDERRDECIEACARLGLPAEAVTFLDVPENSLASHADALDAALQAITQGFAPDEVFVPSRVDAHLDHRALAASVDRLRSDTWPDARVYAYPVWFWNRWAWVERDTPRWRQTLELGWRPMRHAMTTATRIVRVEPFADVKAHALAAHRSQVDASYVGDSLAVLDPDWLSMFLGSEELFFVVRSGRPLTIVGR